MVRLVVVQSDVEKASDDAVLRANPRPRVRGDCEPLECPHCGKKVAMRVLYAQDVDDPDFPRGQDELRICCPDCGQRVMHHHDLDGVWLEWDPDSIYATIPPKPSMMNHCRPCPWVGCVHHLFLDVMDNGASIRMNFPSKEPDELAATCALDEAERDGMTLDEVGKTINITRERVRQLIEQALKASRKNTNAAMFKSALDIEDVNALPELRHPLTEAE